MSKELKKGDRVRVTFEAEVLRAGQDHTDLPVLTDDGFELFLTATDVVEKIEPPVTVFKPGDVVRDKRNGTVRALSTRGWVCINEYPGQFTSGSISNFTSEHYELVSLG